MSHRRDLEVVDVEDVGPGEPTLLIEIPHAADSREHFQAVRTHLVSDLPEDLIAFYFVNTDVGATAVARAVAELLAARGLGTRILRCLVPRTFVDCNRELSVGPEIRTDDGLTPAIPGYVGDPRDRQWLASLHEQYHRAAADSLEAVCGRGGHCINLHTYAPRSVQLGAIRDDVVTALRRAYEPGVYETWALRPEVDLITETPEGMRLGDEEWLRRVREAYASVGVGVAENGAYRLIPGTMGRVYSQRYPGRLLCVEIRRDLLADPFDPFEEMHIGADKARRMAEPLAAAFQPRG